MDMDTWCLRINTTLICSACLPPLMKYVLSTPAKERKKHEWSVVHNGLWESSRLPSWSWRWSQELNRHGHGNFASKGTCPMRASLDAHALIPMRPSMGHVPLGQKHHYQTGHTLVRTMLLEAGMEGITWAGSEQVGDVHSSLRMSGTELRFSSAGGAVVINMKGETTARRYN